MHGDRRPIMCLPRPHSVARARRLTRLRATRGFSNMASAAFDRSHDSAARRLAARTHKGRIALDRDDTSAPFRKIQHEFAASRPTYDFRPRIDKHEATCGKTGKFPANLARRAATSRALRRSRCAARLRLLCRAAQAMLHFGRADLRTL